jgi:hypothetical protein
MPGEEVPHHGVETPYAQSLTLSEEGARRPERLVEGVAGGVDEFDGLGIAEHRGRLPRGEGAPVQIPQQCLGTPVRPAALSGCVTP